jgi:hypothetical protein
VDRVTQPAERRKLWHNAMSPEQNFGVIALRAGAPGSYHIIDGEPGEWKKEPDAAKSTAALQPVGDGFDAMRTITDLTLDHDAEFLHIRLRVEDLDPDKNGVVDWDKVDYVLAFDTIDPKRGDSRLDPKGQVQVERRVEFQLRIAAADDVQLFVDKPYDLFGLWHKMKEKWQLYKTVQNDAGEFNLVRTITNAEYGWTNPATGNYEMLGPMYVQETGRFTTGREVDNTNSNFWYSIANRMLEIRIPWNLLNVTDPSSRMVVDDDGLSGKNVSLAKTLGISVLAVAMGGGATGGAAFVDSLPAASKTGTGWLVPAAGMPTLSWPTWEDAPPYHEYKKASWYILKDKLRTVVPASAAVAP